MANFDTCTGCSSGRQGFSSYTYSFSKKLLVATCLAVIITMCLTPTEAASLERRKERQRLQDMTVLTKDMLALNSETHMRHKRRHQRDQTKLTKDSFYSSQPKEEKVTWNMNDKIIRKLKNTLRDFNQKKNMVNYSVEFRDSSIKLPTTNFMDVRFHNYKANKPGTTLLQRKFAYIMPKLYKSLKKYHEIFKTIAKFKVTSPDIILDEYQRNRTSFLNDTMRNLHGTIVTILDGLKASHIDVPSVNKSQLHLEYFKKPEEPSELLALDGTVIRGYSITLNRWHCLLTSKETRRRKEQQKCMKLEKKMKDRRQHRKQKTRKRIAH